LRGFIRAILSRFDIALAQDDETARLLSRLGMARDRIETTGSLKEGATALPADAGQLAQLCDDLGGRPVWCAASTHPGEEHVILAAHQKLLRRLPRALLILVPRHPERGDDLAAIIADMGLAYAQRSMGGRPKAGDQLYLGDTLGELGLWYRVAPVSFIGGSLEPIGGHNPFEPALLGSAIIHGPHITNFNDIFTRLAKAKAAWPVQDTDDLAGAIETLLTQDIAAEMAQDALKTVSAGSDIAAHVADLILAHLDKGKP
jgi:3-deoxy-D-manno-octulosonic-acid transferase